MKTELLKTRILVLWIWMAVAMSAHSVLSFMEPGVLEQIVEMEMGSGMLFFSALFWIIPLIMAFLTVTLKASADRWANMIMGGLFTLMNIFHLAEHLAQPSAHQIMIIGSTVVATALIFVYALKWPKEEL
ncbi:MAG: hypothetical protein MOIL_01291 [Candidatus Methanolliviera sp. GoM_oil]|nr:MAG: hypothetical protein MOIL_01291 [Candidatus Methanolliviera sp. GoM_oil]